MAAIQHNSFFGNQQRMTYEETLAWIADIFEESRENIHPELRRNEIERGILLGP